MSGFFDGFEERHLALGTGETVRFRVGGQGPPVVLLHGHPRTHTTWHRVAPLLAAAGHTVVCPDLRGGAPPGARWCARSEEHTSELQSHVNLVCRLLLEKKKKKKR